ncbi:hypothetical protein NDU88_004963 [Pleurodeles waltl]|uniref:Secreted protein n=1 Tax=Pleurodeles waltl TaxID=8319 RepID=A0AAV7WBY5_PLEWA|nr:hypothetical protein NDU88_004963 [Pleurodeles waltl]
MEVGVVTARERGVVVGVLVMVVVAVEVVHAGVSVDGTGREEGDEEEGDTVDVGVSARLWGRTSELFDLLAVVLHRHCPLEHVRRNGGILRCTDRSWTCRQWRKDVIITYRLDRATIQELCSQLEPDLMSAIRHPTGIPSQV